jgi:hypothetical protein
MPLTLPSTPISYMISSSTPNEEQNRTESSTMYNQSIKGVKSIGVVIGIIS